MNRFNLESAPSSLTISGWKGSVELERLASPTAPGFQPPSLRKFTGKAYSGAPVSLGWGPDMIFDLDGMACAEKGLPMLRQHNANKIAGYAESVSMKPEVSCTGTLCDTDPGKEVASLSDQGFSWQMSVGLDVQSYEYLDDGQESQINGRKCEGPMLVARKSRLREISFVPMGADENTSAFALSGEGAGMIPVTRTKREPTVADNEKAAADAVAAERKRVSDIKAAFPGDSDHALEHIEKGSSVLEAQAAHAGKLTLKIAEMQAQNLALSKAQAKPAQREARDPVNASAGSTSGTKDEWNRAVQAHRLAGKSGIEAARAISREMPDLHRAFLAESQIVGATRR